MVERTPLQPSSAPAVAAATAPSLKSLVFKGATWTVAGHGAGQLIRFAKNLILTRLLFPEAFGVMSLVWMTIFALEMLSDVGIGPAIVRERRVNDAQFLHTAWTVQIIRGTLFWIAACFVARPMATFYGEAELAYLIPVAGLTALIAGFNSTAVHTCRREMNYRLLTLLDIGNEIIGFVAVVLWAAVSPTVWALVGGALLSRLFFLIGSHLFLPGILHRFLWDASCARALLAFGKWMFLASAFGFVALQGDRLLLGRYLNMAQLGVYSVAVMLAEAVYAVTIKVNHGVLFPAYGKVAHEGVPRLGSVFHRAHKSIDMLWIAPISTLMVLANWVISLLYDQRYEDAGWILQLLCVRLIMSSSLTNSEACLVAMGRPQYAFTERVCRAGWILAGIPIGWSLSGMRGAVAAVATCEVPVLVVQWIGLIRHRLFSAFLVLHSLFFCAVGMAVGFAILWVLKAATL